MRIDLDDWLIEIILKWLSSKPVMHEAWIFGSRVKGTNSVNSDVDLAVQISPEDGKVLAEWIFNAANWKTELQNLIGSEPRIDLQLADPENDEVVWPAVMEHGVQIYHKGRQ